MLILLFGALILLFLGLKINSKIEQQAKILSKLMEEKSQHKSRMIVFTSDREIEILGTAIKMKVPKLTQLLGEKGSINSKRSRNGGEKFGRIGAIHNKKGEGKGSAICPLMGEQNHSYNSTAAENDDGIIPPPNFGVSFWRSVRFQNVVGVISLAIVLLLVHFLVGTVIRCQNLATPNDGKTETDCHFDTETDKTIAKAVKSNGTVASDAFGVENGGEIWQTDEGQKENNVPLETSVWWQYFSAPVKEQRPKKGAEIDVPTPQKPSILKKRPSKKPFEMDKIQNGNDSVKSHRFDRFANCQLNKDVHFVARTSACESAKQINTFSDLMANRLSPKETHFELFNENSRLFFILRHPPDKKGTNDQQFMESLEEKMAKRIAEENCWGWYSNRTNNSEEGHRKKATKWVRLLAAIERRRTNKTTPMKANHSKKAIG
ncbi:hypothetical protein niasHT_039429 [Heterodera trifolii]|uniref:Uncharacterized protein n=1 Tax=Heterodera trifolii TaxID=157864 RepID=A0ABD2J845_9BILA